MFGCWDVWIFGRLDVWRFGSSIPARSTSDGSADKSNNNNDINNIASRIPAAQPEGSPFVAAGIISF